MPLNSKTSLACTEKKILLIISGLYIFFFLSVKNFLLVLKQNFQAVIPALYSSKGSSYCNDVLGATWLVSTLPLQWGTMKSIMFP